MKRLFDIIVASVGLLVASPLLVVVLVLVWLQDFKSPFYIAPRVGKNGKIFKMVKIRSMVVRADQTGVDSTSADDKRITLIGKFVRKFKIDEITQLWNVLWGQMSLVGPRPNVQRDVNLYTEKERELLSVRPGITDFSSIVFSDEGDILKGYPDPDLRYNQVIRPWKSRLGIFYIENNNFLLDGALIGATAAAAVSREKALSMVQFLLKKAGADDTLVEVAARQKPLQPYPPPGASTIVTSR